MGRYNHVKVATFSNKVNITEIDPDFQFFDIKVTHREGNLLTVVSHEYYRPSYRTRFRRPGRKNRNAKVEVQIDEDNGKNQCGRNRQHHQHVLCLS